MSQRLADLVSRLEQDVPAVSGVPTSSQLADAVKDAVSTLSGQAPTFRAITLSVIKGTGTYALPADFLRLRSLAGLPRDGAVIIGSEGIIPLSGPAALPGTERVSVSGSDLVIWPTPAYTLARTLEYDAAHVLDEDERYPYLTDAQGRVALLKARANVLRLQATATARQAWTYQLGDERVSKEKLSAALQAQAREFDEQFSAALATLRSSTSGGRTSPYGTRARVEL
jgi:hypothetical protein